MPLQNLAVSLREGSPQKLLENCMGKLNAKMQCVVGAYEIRDALPASLHDRLPSTACATLCTKAPRHNSLRLHLNCFGLDETHEGI